MVYTTRHQALSFLPFYIAMMKSNNNLLSITTIILSSLFLDNVIIQWRHKWSVKSLLALCDVLELC